jgi:NADH dehydrogenase FAD-containing subunit
MQTLTFAALKQREKDGQADTMGKHLVLVGAGHAHMTALMHAVEYRDKGHRVTLISPYAYHYYSGMGPGMLAGLYQPREARFNVGKMAADRGAAFIEGSAARIDPDSRRLLLDDGRWVRYDIASFNTGSTVPVAAPLAPKDRIIPVKPVLNLYKARSFILNEGRGRELQILVAGGGPAGVEVAANVWRLLRDHGRSAQITLVAGKQVLENLPVKARSFALGAFAKRGITTREGLRLQSVAETYALLADGSMLAYDYAFMAVGVKPSAIFRNSGLRVAEDGGLPVNAFLQSVDHPELFGGGDCISMVGHNLARVGVYAVRQNPILHHNLMVALDGGEMKTFVPSRSYMLILNMGDGSGILCKNRWVWKGRLAFLLKDYIDKRFMRRFQVSGELMESTDEYICAA